MLKSLLIKITLVLVVLFCFLQYQTKSDAFTMSNAFYIIILGNLNSIAGEVSGTGGKLVFTSGELGAGLYTGTNFTLCAGFYGGIFCNAPAAGLFTFTVTPTSLDFGTIDPTSPVTRTNTLNVLSSGGGYSVTAIEDHSLRQSNATVFIPDTTCDNGSCSISTSAPWTSNLTYGFGYRCDNLILTDCVVFNTDYYKPFANQSTSQTPQVVMQATNGSGSEKQSQITYKVNVSGTQLPGVYTNTITYVATPNF